MASGKKKETLTPEERLQAALVPESEQPYPVPENWCWVYAPSMFNIEYGKGLPTRKLCEDGYPVFGANGQIGFYNEYMFEDEKALMSCRGAYSGTMNLSLPKSFITNNSLVIESKLADVSVKLVFYLYSALNKANLISGSAQPQVTVQAFNNYPVPIPPLHEQQRIVDRIESLFAKLDEVKQKVQDALDSFETRKAAILHKAFTGELTAQWRKEHGVGMESWTHNSLGKYLQPPESKKPQGEEFRYIDIDSIDNINQVVREPKKISVKNAPSRANRGLKNNDIVFSMVRPYLKNIAYIDESLSDCIASTGFYVCRCKQDLLSRYLYHLLCSRDAIDYLMQFMKGDNSPSIRKNDLLGMPVSSPLISEQAEIVRILDDFRAKEQQAKEVAEGVLEQIDLIKKAILARAFRGELGTNDPSEESAIKLLERSFSETIEIERVKPKQVAKKEAEVIFVPKTIMEALSTGMRLTPENLKRETELPIDDFYARLKELIDNGSVVESRENGESYLEAANENRQAENQ